MVYLCISSYFITQVGKHEDWFVQVRCTGEVYR